MSWIQQWLIASYSVADEWFLFSDYWIVGNVKNIWKMKYPSWWVVNSFQAANTSDTWVVSYEKDFIYTWEYNSLKRFNISTGTAVNTIATWDYVDRLFTDDNYVYYYVRNSFDRIYRANKDLTWWTSVRPDTNGNLSYVGSDDTYIYHQKNWILYYVVKSTMAVEKSYSIAWSIFEIKWWWIFSLQNDWNSSNRILKYSLSTWNLSANTPYYAQLWSCSIDDSFNAYWIFNSAPWASNNRKLIKFNTSFIEEQNIDLWTVFNFSTFILNNELYYRIDWWVFTRYNKTWLTVLATQNYTWNIRVSWWKIFRLNWTSAEELNPLTLTVQKTWTLWWAWRNTSFQFIPN